jgi:hypothetical protein
MTTIHPSSIQNPFEPDSLQSTPILEIPGAFPSEQHTRQHPLSDSRRATDSQQPISLPSTEKEGTHPGEHCGGVGPLPGSISETSVAKLPDERETEAKTAPGPSSRTKEVFADDDDPREAVATAVAPASTSAAKVPEGEDAPESALRSKELAADTGRGDDAREGVPAAGEHRGGVGSLPGSPSETSVAKLPEERASEAKTAPGQSSRTKEVFSDDDDPREAVAPASTSATKGEAAPESALRSKELAVDTGRGDDTREGVPVAASLVADKDSPVQKTEPQGSLDAIGKQIPTAQRAETSVSLSDDL